MQKDNNTKRVVKYLWNQRKVAPYLAWAMLITQVVIAVLSSVIAPLFVSKLLTHVADGTASMKNDFGLLITYSVILLFSSLIIVRLSMLFTYLAEAKMLMNAGQKILEHLTSKSLGFHANRMSGGLVSDSNKLIGSIERFWDLLAFNITQIVTTVISICVALCFIFWPFAIITAFFSIFIISIVIKVQLSRVRYSEEIAKKSSAVTARLADIIGNISAVKAFAREKMERKKYQMLYQDWRGAMMKEMKFNILTSAMFGLIMNSMSIVAFATAIIITENHMANVGVTYLVINYTLNIVSQFWATTYVVRNFMRIIGDATPMIKTLDEKIELTDPKNPEKFSVKKGEILFDNICFTHENNSSPLFKDFTLAVKPGERIGLVGKSGAGKTSLTRLLLRFSDIESGRILIDGQDVSKTTQRKLRESIAFVPQDPALFHRSLRENIAYGRPNATEKEIMAAAEKANAIDFINTLPDKFDTIVGERGVKLSGGQRQRVAIARVILKDAPILVLDEATSALDSESEHLIQDALAELMKNRTSIVIAHRLSTISKLDRIIVIDDGEIAEEGTHQELLNKDGIYARLWRHQSGGFIEE